MTRKVKGIEDPEFRRFVADQESLYPHLNWDTEYWGLIDSLANQCDAQLMIPASDYGSDGKLAFLLQTLANAARCVAPDDHSGIIEAIRDQHAKLMETYPSRN